MLALNKCLPIELWSEIESSYVLNPYTQSIRGFRGERKLEQFSGNCS